MGSESLSQVFEQRRQVFKQELRSLWEESQHEERQDA